MKNHAVLCLDLQQVQALWDFITIFENVFDTAELRNAHLKNFAWTPEEYTEMFEYFSDFLGNHGALDECYNYVHTWPKPVKRKSCYGRLR